MVALAAFTVCKLSPSPSTPHRRCVFDHFINNYTILRYPVSSTNASRSEFLGELGRLLERHEVREEDWAYIYQQLESGNYTSHVTTNSQARRFYEQRLRASPFLLEFIVRMYYWDYKLFNYTLPEIQYRLGVGNK